MTPTLVLLAGFAAAAVAQTPDAVESALGWRAALSLAAPADPAPRSGFRFVQVDSTQVTGSDAEALRRRLEQSGARVAVYRLSAAPAGEADWRRAAGIARQLGAALLVAPAGSASVPAGLEPKVAIDAGGADPEKALANAARLGAAVWCDPAAWRAAGTRPLAALYMLRGRLAGGTLPPGPLADEFLKEAYRLDIKPLVWVIAPAAAAAARKSLDGLVQYHANYTSRTGGVRRFGEITPEERARIDAAIPSTAPASPRRPRRLLVFDLNVGRFGHPSIAYANLAMERMGSRTGAYSATVSSDPAMLEPARLRQFDAVFLNNTIGDIFSTAAARDAFAAFVTGGGGVVANHAATVTATDWPEFGEILGARGASHRISDEKVTIRVEDPSHPVTRAFGAGPFEFADEIFRFQAPYSRDKVRVLLSVDVERTDMNQGRCAGQCLRDDNDYPVAWVRQHGRGRVFYTTIGHNASVFWEPRMLAMFLAAIQYALGDLEADATPRPHPAPDLDAVLRGLSSYRSGQDQGPLRRLDRAMGLVGSSPAAARAAEARFIAFLGSDAAAEAKGAVCRQLAIVGSAASVPALAALLRTPGMAEPARYALERIDSPDALAALRQALPAASAREQAGLIHSLGRRRDAASLPALRKLLGASDASLRAASANALGMIATPEAEAALWGTTLDGAVSDALLAIAAGAPRERALVIYRRLLPGPESVRPAALAGMARVAGSAALPDLNAALRSDAPALRAAAILHLAAIDQTALGSALPQLPAPSQVQALGALSRRDAALAHPLLIAALRSESEPVRVAALEGLALAGTASDVALLAGLAAAGPPQEQKAARAALARLPGAPVDAAIAASLASAEGKVQLELIRAAGDRGIAAAAAPLIGLAGSGAPEARRASLRALRDVAPPAEAPRLAALLPKCGEDDRADCERALAHALRRAAKPDLQPVLRAYATQPDAAVRSSLLNVLGSVASPDGLPLLRQALSASEAEVRRAAIAAIGEWPTPDPMNDLIEAARGHADPAVRVLALRGYVRLVRHPSERPAPETARLLAAAMQAAARPDEKKLVLAAVQRFPCAESLDLVRAAASDPALAAEARVAARVIEAGLKARGN